MSPSNRKDDRFRKFNLTSVAKNFLVYPDVIRVGGLEFLEVRKEIPFLNRHQFARGTARRDTAISVS